MPPLITKISSDIILGEAYHWLCKRRKKFSLNNEVWDLRWHWHDVKPKLQQALLMGEYRFSPLVELRFPDGNLGYWCTVDSLVLNYGNCPEQTSGTCYSTILYAHFWKWRSKESSA